MGTCYSKAGNEVVSADYKNRPKKKRKESYKNGQIKDYPKLMVEECDIVQTDVSDTVYTEDSHTINVLDIDNCINRSQQTSLDHLLMRDNLSKTAESIEVSGECSDGFQDVTSAVNNDELILEEESNSKTEEKDINDDEFVHISATCSAVEKDVSAMKQTVMTSDSGIEMEHQDSSVERTNNVSDKYSADFESNFEEHETNAKLRPGYDVDKSTKLLKDNPDSCTCHKSCKHGALKEHSSNNSVQNGECQEGLLKTEKIFKRNSETFILKSSLKSRGTKSRAKKGLSWKSADSLDWSDSLGSSMDRTKSVCSSILGDNLSLLNAPLAAFASSDFALGSSYDFSKRLRENLKQNIDCSTDSLQFQFDFSGLDESQQSVASIDSESCKISDSSTDLEKIKLAISQSAVSTTPTHRPSTATETTYELPAVSLQQPEVMRMNMNGRDVVVVDADLFSQIIDEVQLLKMKLTHLTQVIQETEDGDVFVPENGCILSSSA